MAIGGIVNLIADNALDKLKGLVGLRQNE